MSPASSKTGSKHLTWDPTARSAGARSSRSPWARSRATPRQTRSAKSCYEGDRFADTIPYAQSYREYLPELAKLLPGIQTPVRIVAGADDQVVPGSNAEFLQERLPNAQVDLIAGAGHFCWEEKPAEYATLLTSWWDRANAASKS